MVDLAFSLQIVQSGAKPFFQLLHGALLLLLLFSFGLSNSLLGLLMKALTHFLRRFLHLPVQKLSLRLRLGGDIPGAALSFHNAVNHIAVTHFLPSTSKRPEDAPLKPSSYYKPLFF